MQGYNGDDTVEATNAELNLPQDVAVDGYGNIYIADSGNNRIRALYVRGYPTAMPTLEPTAHPTLSFNDHKCIAGVQSTFDPATEPAKAVAMASPAAVWPTPDGNILVADTGNNRIVKLWVTGESIGVVKSVSPNLGGKVVSRANVMNTTGAILQVVGGGNDLTKLVCSANGCTPADLGDGGSALKAFFDTPLGVCMDTSGNVFIADTNNNLIRVIYRNSLNITTYAGTGAGAGTGTGKLPHYTATHSLFLYFVSHSLLSDSHSSSRIQLLPAHA